MSLMQLTAGLGFNDNYKSLSAEQQERIAAVEKTEREQNQALTHFLSGVEKRAFRMAQIATNNSDDALDIVQDAMFKLVEKYSAKTPEEWGGLFHRILQSRIRDWYRRSSVRNRFRYWFVNDSAEADSNEEDIFQKVKDESGRSPEQLFETGFEITTLESSLRSLPLRQQQAFLLRAWEGLSVKETAAAMACSDGSVKTHYHRAIHTLRKEMSGEL